MANVPKKLKKLDSNRLDSLSEIAILVSSIIVLILLLVFSAYVR